MPPESGGLFFNSDIPTGVFRIDHDQSFEQTTQAQYTFQRWKKLAPYVNFTWRYDSGLVVSGVPDAGAALGLTPNQQVTIGLACNGVFATVDDPITDCRSGGGKIGNVTSTLIKLPQGCTYHPRCPFVIDACKDREPELLAVDMPEHDARCIRWQHVAEVIGTGEAVVAEKLAAQG